MKKLFLSLVAAIVAATATYAQSSMLATLSHEGQISTFYGQNALKDAHAAAVHGDIITLSSGSFNAVNITKAVTIRGAGMTVDSIAKTEPTVIVGDFTIEIPNDVTERLTLEGIFHNFYLNIKGSFKNGTFIKDRFKTIQHNNSSSDIATNLTMIHCRVSDKINAYSYWTVSCVNCIINGMLSGNTNNFEFLNCIVNNYYFDESRVAKSSFKNCILGTTYNYASLSTSAVAYNCIGIGSNNLFQYIPNNTNVVKNNTDVFKTYTGTYSDSETFELTDEAKEAFLGIDGTQVGIYGGNMPFNSTPTNPQITKCNVAAKSTADGKLSVDITVNGAK